MRKRTKIAATAGVVLVIAGAGAAVAADRLTARSESEAVLNDAAEQLGIDPTRLTDALEQALKNRVDDLVEDGQLTEEQGDAIKERIDLRELPLFAPQLLRTHGPGLGRGFGPGFGPGLFFHRHGEHLDTASEYLGLEEAELREALRDGKSLADVAREQGKSVDGLVDALVAAEEEELQEAVDEGKLTDAQRDRIVESLEERVEDAVNRELRVPRLPGSSLFGFGAGPGLFFQHLDEQLDTAADYLGLERAELSDALRGGKSLADVAKEEGKSVDGLVDVLVAASERELQEAVDDGELTDAQRDRIVEELEERVTDAVNGELRFGPLRIDTRIFKWPGTLTPKDRSDDD